MEETALVALLTQMVRNGLIDVDTIHDAADECEARGQEMPAHQLRCLIVEASVTPATERQKEQRRAAMRVIDGGNAD